jgi:hypothetical protein
MYEETKLSPILPGFGLCPLSFLSQQPAVVVISITHFSVIQLCEYQGVISFPSPDALGGFWPQDTCDICEAQR